MKQNSFSKLLVLSLLSAASTAWADGTDVTATYITNPGFETGNLDGWARTGKVDGYNASGVYNDNTHTGKGQYATWAEKVTTIDVYQVLHNVAAGQYTLTAWTRTDGNNGTQHIYAKRGTVTERSAAPALNNNQVWESLTLSFTSDGVTPVTIGAAGHGNGNAPGGWFCIDDFTLTQTGDAQMAFSTLQAEAQATLNLHSEKSAEAKAALQGAIDYTGSDYAAACQALATALSTFEAAVNTYTFDARDWAYTGDVNRVNQSDITVADNKLTVRALGNNNVALKFGNTNGYHFTSSATEFVISGTGLSTNAGDAYLWWINNTNVASQLPPTTVTTEGDVVTFTWSLLAMAESMRVSVTGNDWTLFSNPSSLSTIFGLTATNGTATITDIHFTVATNDDVHERTTAAGNFGTICLPRAANSLMAEIYSVSSINGSSLELQKLGAEEQMAPGTPYIYKATEDNPTFTMSGDAVAEPVAATGLVGTFTETTAPKGDSYFVLSGNKLYNVDAEANVTVGANRAYIDLTAVPSGGEVKAEATYLALIGYGTTGLVEVKSAREANGICFDLSGRRVSHPQRGLYVVNGKKVIVQ